MKLSSLKSYNDSSLHFGGKKVHILSLISHTLHYMALIYFISYLTPQGSQ